MSPHGGTPGEVIPGLRPAVFDLHDACSEWRQGGASITGLADVCVGRTLPVTTLLPQCLLQVETGRCVHCLICCIITMMLAPSGDRAVPASLDYLMFVLKKLING